MFETPFILASGSPRRLELLQQVGYQPYVVKPSFEEQRLSSESISAYLKRNVEGKLQSVVPTIKEYTFLIVSADTVVTQDEILFEKPKDAKDAQLMLERFSGASHQVMTGYLLGYFENTRFSFDYQLVSTRVDFRVLSNREIKLYIDSGEPFDKAGGYGIQGAASSFVDKIEGSYTNVVGLPLSQLQESISRLLSIEN